MLERNAGLFRMLLSFQGSISSVYHFLGLDFMYKWCFCFILLFHNNSFLFQTFVSHTRITKVHSINYWPWSFSSSSSGSEILSSSSSSAAERGDRGDGGASGPSASLPEWSPSPSEPALPPPLLERFSTGLWSVGEPGSNKDYNCMTNSNYIEE